MMNQWLVGMAGKRIIIGRAPGSMTPDEAIQLAAWLVALAQPFATTTFDAALKEISQA